MKPFKTCPACNSEFTQFHSGGMYLESCVKACISSAEPCMEHNCSIQFRQSFDLSFKDDTISNFQIYTKHFFLYSYFNDRLFGNETHVYYRIFPRGQSTQSPVFKIDNLVLDLTDKDSVEKFDKKYFTLSLFI